MLFLLLGLIVGYFILRPVLNRMPPQTYRRVHYGIDFIFIAIGLLFFSLLIVAIGVIFLLIDYNRFRRAW